MKIMVSEEINNVSSEINRNGIVVKKTSEEKISDGWRK
jgi:hypothetical protein